MLPKSNNILVYIITIVTLYLHKEISGKFKNIEMFYRYII